MADSTAPTGGPAHGRQTQWWRTLAPAETEIDCGDGRHVIRWENGTLALPAHADAGAEMVLAALGGDKPGCVELAELWARHHDDLDVLTLGPRWDGDEALVSREDVEAARSEWHFPRSRPRTTPMRRHLTGFGAMPGSAVPGLGLTAGGQGAMAMSSQIARARARQAELLELLALGPAFQMRLTASVAAAWQARARTGPDQPGPGQHGAGQPGPGEHGPGQQGAGRHGPVLTAALTGRFALVAESWLGIDATLVTACPHTGAGWGEMELTGPSGPSGHTWRQAGHGLRASLPLDWLARIWAPGLALVRRYLVVAVLEARWPDARVLALTAPGADPVTLEVRATDDQPTPGGGAHWEITDTGEEAART
jgi:hypothetical protein